ncbi:MAG: hypothetical protein ACOC16_02980 [Nanoarchaeota archaeon]
MITSDKLKELKKDMILEVFNNPKYDVLIELKLLNIIFEIIEENVRKKNESFIIFINKIFP